MTVSVIIPVYNASATLGRCLDSLSSQLVSLASDAAESPDAPASNGQLVQESSDSISRPVQEFPVAPGPSGQPVQESPASSGLPARDSACIRIETVLIDDCSTDDSLSVLRAYASSHSGVKLIQHPRNRGVAAARNSGLDAATGDFVYFLDADDWLEPDALVQMASKAIREDLDIVGCGWRLAFDQRERAMSQPDFRSPLEALRQMMYGRMKWNLWLFLVRRSLYDGIRFVPGQDMGEDMLVMHRLFLRAGRVGLVNRALYHYALPNLSANLTDRHISQLCANVSVLEEQLKSFPYEEKLLPLLPLLKLNIKLPLLISSDRKNYRRWMEWWPESNAYVLRSPALPLRTRLLQWCAARKLWAVLRLYHFAVTRFVYGIIYK